MSLKTEERGKKGGTMLDDTLEDTGETMRSYVQLVSVLNKKSVSVVF